MEENNDSENKGPLYFLLHGGIVFLVFILLTIWMMSNKQGGADIGRWGAQGVLYFIQLLFILIIHQGTNNIKYAFWGATIVFIIVFIIEISYNGGTSSLFY